MQKLIVRDDLCIGCGACIAIDNAHFDFNENGLSSVISNENLDSLDVQNAINACPVNAIKIEKCPCGDACKCENNCNCTEDNCCCKD